VKEKLTNFQDSIKEELILQCNCWSSLETEGFCGSSNYKSQIEIIFMQLDGAILTRPVSGKINVK
jgi:hypothetical protein